MKLTMKKTLLAAAIATIAASGAANAAMSSTTSGDSSLIMTLLDTTVGVSATFDLGFSKSTFNQAANNIWNVAGGDYAAAWSSFNTAVAGNFANTQYAVFAGDNFSANVAGDKSIFTTVASAWSTVSNSTLGNMQSNFDKYIVANNALPNHNLVTDGGSFTTSTGPLNSYAGVPLAYSNTGKIGGAGGDTNTLLGTNMNVWNIVNSAGAFGTSSATKLSVAGFNPYFNMSNTGTLSYTAVAAVPEADTSALLLAGLGLMGFIARRRMSV